MAENLAEKAGKAGERAVARAEKACTKPPRKEQTRRFGGHLAAGAAVCTLEVNARHTFSKQFARNASSRDTKKATVAESHWATRRCASVAAKRATTKKNVQKTQMHANGAKSEDTLSKSAHTHRDMFQRRSTYKSFSKRPGQQVQNSNSRRVVHSDANSCGPDNIHEYKWICDGCGGLVIDDGDSATGCPGCSTAKGKKREPTQLQQRASCRK